MIVTKRPKISLQDKLEKEGELPLWTGFKMMQGQLMLRGNRWAESCKSEGRSVLLEFQPHRQIDIHVAIETATESLEA